MSVRFDHRKETVVSDEVEVRGQAKNENQPKMAVRRVSEVS